MPGILAIWHDRDDAIAETYERWVVGEHIPERLAVPGFLEARRYEAVRGAPRFFTPYVVASPAVLASPEYLARLASPTPLTREVMAGFRNMTRTVCDLAYRSPAGATGGYAVVAYALQPAALDDGALRDAALACERGPGALGVQLWRAASAPGRPASSEANLRPGGDRAIEAALVVDALREADALALEATVADHLRRCAGAAADGSATVFRSAVYRFLALWRPGIPSHGVDA